LSHAEPALADSSSGLKMTEKVDPAFTALLTSSLPPSSAISRWTAGSPHSEVEFFQVSDSGLRYLSSCSRLIPMPVSLTAIVTVSDCLRTVTVTIPLYV